MTKRHKHIIKVDGSVAPVVELDSLAYAAYIRFSQDKVRRAVVVDVKGCLATMGLAENGAVIGVGLVGVDEFRIETLFKQLGFVASPKNRFGTRVTSLRLLNPYLHKKAPRFCGGSMKG